MAIPKVKTSSELRDSLAETISEANQGREQIITHKSGNVILISEESYSKLLKENEDLKQIALGISELESGKGIPQAEAKKQLKSLINKWS
jgi:PHD/YefM family antitoxin component YafN of YafNO toxin-antitoxin module